MELQENKHNYLKSFFQIFNYDNKVKKEDIEKGEIRNYDKLIASFFQNHAEKKELNIYSCFYCDSAFIGMYNKKKDRTFDVDHFFPKEQYPIFALSLYNFVPSCQICNSRVKGASKFTKFYNIENKDLFMREISPTSKKYNFKDNVKIRLEPYISNINEKQYTFGENFIENEELYHITFDSDANYGKIIEAFKLEKRYNMISIKNYALNLQDLKKKYPLQKILEMCEILNQNGIIITPQEMIDSIFHENQEFSLLEKLRNDILR